MQILAVTVKGTITLDVEADDTIEEVRAKIRAKVWPKPDEPRLSFNGKRLEDGRTLAECGVEDGSATWGFTTLLDRPSSTLSAVLPLSWLPGWWVQDLAATTKTVRQMPSVDTACPL